MWCTQLHQSSSEAPSTVAAAAVDTPTTVPVMPVPEAQSASSLATAGSESTHLHTDADDECASTSTSEMSLDERKERYVKFISLPLFDGITALGTSARCGLLSPMFCGLFVCVSVYLLDRLVSLAKTAELM